MYNRNRYHKVSFIKLESHENSGIWRYKQRFDKSTNQTYCSLDILLNRSLIHLTVSAVVCRGLSVDQATMHIVNGVTT